MKLQKRERTAILCQQSNRESEMTQSCRLVYLVLPSSQMLDNLVQDSIKKKLIFT